MNLPRIAPRPARRRRTAVAAVTALACAVLAACGSTLDPNQVAATSAQGGMAAPGEVVPGGTDAGGDVTGTTGATGSGPATSTGGGGGAASGEPVADAPQDSDEAAPPGADKKGGNCDGLKNGTGITDKTITIANAADISGPIPGLFESAQQAVKAYVAFFNASSDICGRKLELVTYDTRTDAGGDQEATTRACQDAFAMVGSISAFDNGGAAKSKECGIPEMRFAAVTPQRGDLSNVFGAQSNKTNLIPASVANYFKKDMPETTKGVAILYPNSAAAIVNSKSRKKAFEMQGFKVVYDKMIASSEFNYGPYVLEMKDAGVELVHFGGTYAQAIRIAQAMEQQDFHPAFVLQAAAYDRGFLEGGGEAIEDTYVYSDGGLFEQPTPELTLYMKWLDQVAPGAIPTYFGQYSWSAARIFTEQAVRLGGKLSRPTLIEAFRGVNNYTTNGMHAPQNPGAERSAECVAMLQVQDGAFVKVSPGRYLCQGLIDTGVGG